MKLIKLLLFSVIVVDFLGLNMTLTLLPSLIITPELSFVPAVWDYHERLFFIGFLTAVYPFGQFIGASIWGKLSDIIGRKKALLIALAFTNLGYIVSAFAVSIQSGLLFFFGRLMIGFSAGNVAIVLATMADISQQGSKSANFSILQTAIGLGLLFGASFGGILSDSQLVSWFSPVVPFIVLTMVIFLTISLIYIVLPNQEIKKPLVRMSKNPLQGISDIKYYLEKKSHRNILGTWSFFVAGMTLFGLMFSPFLVAKFRLDTSNIGLLLMFWGCVYTFAQFLIVKPLSKFFTSHYLLNALMLFPGIIATSLFFYNYVYQLYIAIFFYAIFLGFVMPNLFSVISDSVEKGEQGKMLGVASSIQGLMTVVMTLIGGALLAINCNLTVVIGGSLMCLAGFLYRFLMADARFTNDYS